jgi:hypothetical protein
VGFAPTSRSGLGGFFKLLLRRDSWVEDIKCIEAEGRPARLAILEHDQTLFEYRAMAIAACSQLRTDYYAAMQHDHFSFHYCSKRRSAVYKRPMWR